MRRLVFDGMESNVLFPIVEPDTAEFNDIMKEELNDQGTIVENEYTKCEECFLEALPRVSTPDLMLDQLQSFNPHVTSLDMLLSDDFEKNEGHMRHEKVVAVYTKKQARRGNQRLSNHLDLDASVGFVFENTEDTEELTVEQFCSYPTKQTVPLPSDKRVARKVGLVPTKLDSAFRNVAEGQYTQHPDHVCQFDLEM